MRFPPLPVEGIHGWIHTARGRIGVVPGGRGNIDGTSGSGCLQSKLEVVTGALLRIGEGSISVVDFGEEFGGGVELVEGANIRVVREGEFAVSEADFSRRREGGDTEERVMGFSQRGGGCATRSRGGTRRGKGAGEAIVGGVRGEERIREFGARPRGVYKEAMDGSARRK